MFTHHIIQQYHPQAYAKKTSYVCTTENMNNNMLRSTFTIAKPKPRNYPDPHHQKSVDDVQQPKEMSHNDPQQCR